MSAKNHHPLWLFILFPAVAMLLGWGLRGYIGGGPFGAMIPGCYVALCLSLLLGLSMPAAATAALLGTVAIGYGGDMTYGLTLGLARDVDTRSWGFLGATIKGAVWGLLGGPVIAVGLMANRYKRFDIVVAFLLTVVAYHLGRLLINVPRLIDFSTRNGEQRPESWAGLLFAAIVFVAWFLLRYRGPEGRIPLRFALWGGLGGGLGFGLGVLWLVYGPMPQKWFGWWKMMEFTFGFLLGGFLGLAAYLDRDHLAERKDAGPAASMNWASLGLLIGLVILIFAVFPVALRNVADDSALFTVARLINGFIVFGCLCVIIAFRSIPAAWQLAVTVTFFHTMVDLTRDNFGAKGFGWPVWALVVTVLGSTAVVGVLAAWNMNGPRPVQRMLHLAVWSCYLTACGMTFLHREYFFPEPGEPGGFAAMMATHASIVVTHGIFTVSAVITSFFVMTRFPTDGEERRLLSQ